MIRANTRKHNKRTETVDHYKKESSEETFSQLLNLPYIFYCFYKSHPYFNLDTVPPTAWIASSADLENA